MDKAYNTGKIMIGRYYEKPLDNQITQEGEFWQSVYLGDYQRGATFRRQMHLYIVFLIILLSTLAMVI